MGIIKLLGKENIYFSLEDAVDSISLENVLVRNASTTSITETSKNAVPAMQKIGSSSSTGKKVKISLVFYS